MQQKQDKNKDDGLDTLLASASKVDVSKYFSRDVCAKISPRSQHRFALSGLPAFATGLTLVLLAALVFLQLSPHEQKPTISFADASEILLPVDDDSPFADDDLSESGMYYELAMLVLSD